MLKIKNTEICECECHMEGKSIIHCSPCCPLTYRKYISKDGEINYISWANFRLLTEPRPEYKERDVKICPNCGYIYFNNKCKKCGRKETKAGE